MDTSHIEKKTKQPLKSTNSYATLRVKKDTRKRVVKDLEKVNSKEFGRRVRIDDYVAFALSLVTPEHHHRLQESTLSNEDRLKRDYKSYVAQHGMISRDEYLGKRLSGEISPPVGSTGAEAQIPSQTNQ